ncbi:hypothetical protein P3G55_18305 [Leptospira sp. 96542]|nr:hypothetical protein [Leptospira sp. 96542]
MMADMQTLQSSPDLGLTDYHNRRIGLSFWHLGATLGQIYLAGDLVFQFGSSSKVEWVSQLVLTHWKTLETNAKPHIPTKIGQFEEENKEFQVLVFRIPDEDGVVILSVLVLALGENRSKHKWISHSLQIKTFLSAGIANRERNVYRFGELARPIHTKMAKAFSGETKSGVIAFFHLQDLSPFFRPLGVVKSEEILREVTSTLQKSVKPNEFTFQLNLRSYFVFCPGETIQGANARFEALYFPSKHLILDYKLKIFPISEAILADRTEFSSIFLENF